MCSCRQKINIRNFLSWNSPILPEVHLWGHTLMSDVWLSASDLIHHKGVLSGWGQDSVQARPSPAPEKQSHTIIPLLQTLHLAQYSQTSTVLLATARPRLVHQTARWRLTLQKVDDLFTLCASASADPTSSFYVAYHFVAELLLFPIAFTLL